MLAYYASIQLQNKNEASVMLSIYNLLKQNGIPARIVAGVVLVGGVVVDSIELAQFIVLNK